MFILTSQIRVQIYKKVFYMDIAKRTNLLQRLHSVRFASFFRTFCKLSPPHFSEKTQTNKQTNEKNVLL